MPQLTVGQIARYHADGYLEIPGLFSQEEVDLLLDVARRDPNVAKAGGMQDGSGGTSRLYITGKLEEDIYGAFVRSRRIVETVEQLFQEPIVRLHHKMMLKEPRVGGAWEWHQDYGYWYNDGYLFPRMASCMIAADLADRGNGCLQVLRGSHLCGRIDHGKVGHQTGADPERVAALSERLDLVYAELEPGTALFFHSNLLHRSDQNRSERSRWSLICCYNAAANQPLKAQFHDNSGHLEPLADDQVLAIGRRQLDSPSAMQRQDDQK